jgi:hypothetical protein
MTTIVDDWQLALSRACAPCALVTNIMSFRAGFASARRIEFSSLSRRRSHAAAAAVDGSRSQSLIAPQVIDIGPT